MCITELTFFNTQKVFQNGELRHKYIIFVTLIVANEK